MAQAHIYHQFFTSLAAKQVNVASDAFKMALLNNQYVPNLGTHRYQSDLTNELPNGNGYTTGGASVASMATSLTSTNCVQTVTISGAPTGGNFTLTLTIGTTTATTAAIAYNATAGTVQTALSALPNVGATNVTVTGSAGGPYTVTFTESLGAQVIAQMTSSNTFTGGTTPAVAVAMTTPGQGTWAITGGNVSWASATFVAPNAARYGVIYDSTPGSAATNPLVGLVDFITDQSPVGGSLALTWDASGIVVVQIS